MRAVVQRVHQASVEVNGEIASSIGMGLLVYLGVAEADEASDGAYLAEKVRCLRIFPDDDKPLHRSVEDVSGEILVISAFTTMADARKGRRPALSAAAEPQKAEQLYELFCEQLAQAGATVRKGRFRQHMDVTAVNDGPICILLDSARRF